MGIVQSYFCDTRPRCPCRSPSSGGTSPLEGDGGCDVLHRAAARVDIHAVFALLDSGADADARDADGNTPLLAYLLSHSATPDVAGEVVQLLINRGCDVNAHEERNQRRSALHVACGRGFERVVEQLLLAGADPDHADRRGRTALCLVLWKLSWQRERFADSAHLRIALRLLRGSRAGVTCRDREGVTPLLLAVATKNPLLLSSILAKGVGRFDADDLAGALLALDRVSSGGTYCRAARARRTITDALARQQQQRRSAGALTLRELCRAALLRRLPAEAASDGAPDCWPSLPPVVRRYVLLQGPDVISDDSLP